jgi:hypothetical protein
MRTNCKSDRENGRHCDRYPSDQKNKHIIDSISVRSVLYREHDDDLKNHTYRDRAYTEIPYADQNLKFQ